MLRNYSVLKDILEESLDSQQLVRYVQQVKILGKAFFNQPMANLIPYLLYQLKEKEIQTAKV